nr:MAG TPA: hypothetical protein [Caudoviricetes sp.]
MSFSHLISIAASTRAFSLLLSARYSLGFQWNLWRQ